MDGFDGARVCWLVVVGWSSDGLGFALREIAAVHVRVEVPERGGLLVSLGARRVLGSAGGWAVRGSCCRLAEPDSWCGGPMGGPMVLGSAVGERENPAVEAVA